MISTANKTPTQGDDRFYRHYTKGAVIATDIDRLLAVQWTFLRNFDVPELKRKEKKRHLEVRKPWEIRT